MLAERKLIAADVEICAIVAQAGTTIASLQIQECRPRRYVNLMRRFRRTC